MSNQDAPETPMNEILASIRNILREDQKPYHPALDRPAPFNRMPAPTAFVKAQPNQDSDDNFEKEVNEICTNINRIIQKPETVSNKVFSLDVNNHRQSLTPENHHIDTQENNDSSDLIVRQFNTFFAERRNKNPQQDNALSKVAQMAVVNEVVPVLQQWIDECLPSIIREEIKRVMAKAGPR